MPGKLKVRVLCARHLPVMDRSSENTDAFAEVKWGETTYKTDVYRKSLNPKWNSDWFRFDASDDAQLQDEPLQVRIMDYDTYSANDAIGKVYIDLNPLLTRAQQSLTQLSSGGSAPPSASLPSPAAAQSASSANSSAGNVQQQAGPSGTGTAPPSQLQVPVDDAGQKPGGATMSGWLPIFDTMQGVRGEVNVIVKLELFSDFNKFRQSSCGVQFFCSSGVPEGYYAQYIIGFVEELVVNDDPEYQWIDKIRTPRASNEARQSLFIKLSGVVRRKIGLKALELGGNAVVGYQQKFDLEGDTGIVVRGIGTAMKLVRLEHSMSGSNIVHRDLSPKESLESGEAFASEAITSNGVTTSAFEADIPHASATAATGGGSKRESPESETGCSPKALLHLPSIRHSNKTSAANDAFDLLEYPFITLKRFPPGYIQRVGGLVSCRSVKLLDGLEEENDTRDGWWQEIRQEIRSHARCLGCNLVVGYTEDTVICDDIVILCASGTAAVGDLHHMLDLEPSGLFGPPFIPSTTPTAAAVRGSTRGHYGNEDASTDCCQLHMPYVDHSLPFSCKTSRCNVCGKGRVPDVLFATIEPPSSYEVTGRGCLLQAKVLRLKRDVKSEHNAKEISDALPFIEYEIHRQLINKLKVKGMNGLFGLKMQVSMGERIIIATATATGCLLSALPSPTRPRLICSASALHSDPQCLPRAQKKLELRIEENERHYGLASTAGATALATADATSELEADVEEGLEADFSAGNKDTCVLEIDDSEDVDIIDSLMDPFPPPLLEVFSTEDIIGISQPHVVRCCQTFSQVWRGKIHPSTRDFSLACQRLLSSIYFKMRRLKPCFVCDVNFQANIDEENEIQLCVYGTAISICSDGYGLVQKDSNRDGQALSNGEGKGSMDLRPNKSSAGKLNLGVQSNISGLRFFTEMRDSFGITVTPLSYVPGAKIDRYLGNLHFCLIRETSGLKEAGGLNTFLQGFLAEVYSIVRAHVAALAGNALVGYFMSEFAVSHSPHKNQAQCLVHVGGDVVAVSHIPMP